MNPIICTELVKARVADQPPRLSAALWPTPPGNLPSHGPFSS